MPLPQNDFLPFLLHGEKLWIRAARDQAKWEVVICNYHWLSEAFQLFGPEVKKIVLTHDVWHQHVYRKSDDPLAEVNERAREQTNLNRADLIIAINSRDAGIFKAMLPKKKIVVAPMSCTAKFNDVAPASGQLLFVGSEYKPNVDGVSWFLNEVGPLLARDAPGRFKLDLVGGVGNVLNGCKPSVPWVARGYVKDITSEYNNAEIVIVPLLAGTGLKIKLIEAFAHGKAIVTTSVGAQGLEKFAGQTFAVANTPEEFAAQLIKISNDCAERLRLESASRRIALTDFSPIACYDELEKCLAS